MKFEILGIIHSSFKAKFGTPRQSQLVKHSQAYIQIEKRWEPYKCLKGLEEFSHAWILFYFHENSNLGYRPVVKPPRLKGKGLGALATRSPLRPNPIGLSLVNIERIEKDRVYISGVDMIEGTPVLDIKPYVKTYDSVKQSKDGWLDSLDQEPIKVVFSPSASKDLKLLKRPYLKRSITDILKSDIRNQSDKRGSREGKILGFYFEELNVVFRFKENRFEVLKIEPRDSHQSST